MITLNLSPRALKRLVAFIARRWSYLETFAFLEADWHGQTPLPTDWQWNMPKRRKALAEFRAELRDMREALRGLLGRDALPLASRAETCVTYSKGHPQQWCAGKTFAIDHARRKKIQERLIAELKE